MAKVLVARDITVQSRLEAERAMLERRLGQSEKLLALGQFVAGVAHELNNPLQGVLGHLELLRASQALPASLRRDLSLVYREADRAARIVHNLLVFAGSGRLRRRALAINAVVARVLQLRAAAHKSRSDRGAARSRRRAAEGQGRRAAAAAGAAQPDAERRAGDGGTRAIGDQHAPLTEEWPRTITLDDSGPGLSPDVKARLFEPFFTTKEVGEGTGLGLAITYGIVKAHGGTIEASNRDEGGARFVITLTP